MKTHHTKHPSASEPEPRDTQKTAPDAAAKDETPATAASPAANAADTQHAAPPSGAEAAAPKIDPMMERLMRLQADFENFRKRVARERIEMAQRAAEDVMKDLLPVLDHFDLALKNAAEHGAPANIVEGLELVFDELMGALAKHGLSAIRVEPGAPFDPHQHEAVAHVASPDIPAESVVQQTRCGYRLGEKLLRPAQVVVSSGSAPAAGL